MTSRLEQLRIRRLCAGVFGVTLLLALQFAAFADDYSAPSWLPRTNGHLYVRQIFTPVIDGVSNGSDLVIVDIESGMSRTLAATPVHDGPADIDDDWVVWKEDVLTDAQFPCTSSIFAADLDTLTPISLAEGLILPSAPRISDGVVVWGALTGRCAPGGSAENPGDYALFIFDLNSSESITTIDPFTGFANAPEIDGDHIVWAESETGGVDSDRRLMSLRIGSDEPPVEHDIISWNSFYAVSGERIAYVNQQGRLVILDTATGGTRFIDDHHAMRLSFDGDILVWEAWVGSRSWELHGYSLSKNERYVLDSGIVGFHPHLAAGTLVWESGDESTGYDIRSATVEEFEQLHERQTQNERRKLLLWGAIAVTLGLGSVLLLRRVRSGPAITLSPAPEDRPVT